MKCKLSGALTITSAGQARLDLLRAMSGPGPFEVDTREVDDVDGAGLQLLLAAFKSAVTAGIPIVFPSEARGAAVSTVLDVIGLGHCEWNREDWLHVEENTRG